MLRGEIWQAELAEPRGSEPAYRRPLVLVQADFFTQTAIQTVLAVAITRNLRLAEMPGNVLIEAKGTGLKENSVANVTQVITVDKRFLLEKLGQVSSSVLRQIDEGLRLVLDL